MQESNDNQLKDLLADAVTENEILRDRVAELEALLVAAQEEIEKREDVIRELVISQQLQHQAPSQEDIPPPPTPAEITSTAAAFAATNSQSQSQSSQHSSYQQSQSRTSYFTQPNIAPVWQQQNIQPPPLVQEPVYSDSSQQSQNNPESSFEQQQQQQQHQSQQIISCQSNSQIESQSHQSQPLSQNLNIQPPQYQPTNYQLQSESQESDIEEVEQLDFLNIKKRIKKFKNN